MSEFKMSVELDKKHLTVDNVQKVSLDSSLDADYDSVTVSKLGKGGATYALSETTESKVSQEVVIEGYNSAILFCYLTGDAVWDIELLQATITNDVFVPIFKKGQKLELKNIASSMSQSFTGLSDYLKVNVKKVSGTGSLTVKVKPFNF